MEILTKKILLLFICIISWSNAFSQDDLEALLNDEMSDITEYTTATFKASRIINGHSIERMPERGLDFRVAHRFGELREGFNELYGLDYASSFIGLEYGINDRIMTGIGRATYKKTFTGFVSVGILQQSKGKKTMPVSVVWCSDMAVTGLHYLNEEQQNDFNSRLSYTHQLLIARKFGPKLSLQLSPTYLHRNLVKIAQQNNDLLALGIGGRYLFTKRTSFNFEYHFVNGLVDDNAYEYYNPLAIGIDIQVSGHVFQLHLTNSEPMTENYFLGETTSDFFNGDIRFGFNIATVFDLD